MEMDFRTLLKLYETGHQAVQTFQKTYPKTINLLNQVPNFKIKEPWNDTTNKDLNIQPLR